MSAWSRVPPPVHGNVGMRWGAQVTSAVAEVVHLETKLAAQLSETRNKRAPPPAGGAKVLAQAQAIQVETPFEEDMIDDFDVEAFEETTEATEFE